MLSPLDQATVTSGVPEGLFAWQSPQPQNTALSPRRESFRQKTLSYTPVAEYASWREERQPQRSPADRENGLDRSEKQTGGRQLESFPDHNPNQCPELAEHKVHFWCLIKITLC